MFSFSLTCIQRDERDMNGARQRPAILLNRLARFDGREFLMQIFMSHLHVAARNIGPQAAAHKRRSI